MYWAGDQCPEKIYFQVISKGPFFPSFKNLNEFVIILSQRMMLVCRGEARVVDNFPVIDQCPLSSLEPKRKN
jgi:hypothetical protein